MNIIEVQKENEVYFKINADIDQLLELKEYLSCYAPNYKFHPKFRARIWNGKISFFGIKDKLLPIGLLSEFKSFLNRFDYRAQFNFNKEYLYNEISKNQVKDFCDKLTCTTDYTLRDYQYETVWRCLKNKRGVIESATGSGKSLSIYCSIRYLLKNNKQVLLVVPNISLVEQMYSDFKDYGWMDIDDYAVRLYSNKIKNFDNTKPVLITTWQSIFRKSENFFERFGGIIVDEVQHLKSVSIQTIAKKCKNADYRLGFTGTLPMEKADRYNIHGFLGQKLFDLKASTLIDKGILSNIKIANVILKYTPEEVNYIKNRDYQSEIDYILDHKKRNKILNKIIDNTPKEHNILLLVNRIEKSLDLVQPYLQEKYPNRIIYRISGQTDANEREQIRKEMEKNNGVILCATYQTMSTGVNIKKLHNVIFFASYKSKIKVLQSIGRGLRKHKSKEKLILWDVVDDFRWKKRTGNIGENHTFKHFKERLKYYKDQGFEYKNKIIKIENL